MELTRRRLLSGAIGAAGAGALAGCAGEAADRSRMDSDAPVVQASFFVFGDLTERVAGDAAAANLLVPIGQHGHGWEPGPRVREDVHGADLFVHGMDGFQPWVDHIRGDLVADEATVATVDVSEGIDLLRAGGGHDHDAEDDHGDDHDADHDDGDEVHDEHEEHDDHDAEDDHGDERDADPHFWMDPLRVKEAVENVRRGVADVDPDNADAYAENAAAFERELDALHEHIESTVAAASTDVILVAGHDSLRYLGERYDLRVEALTDLSPDDRPSTRDVRRAQEIIETHDLRYVCADPLESQLAADQLVSETDAEDVLALTAMPGLTEEWEENGWGYVDVMENVNLPSLERALDA